MADVFTLSASLTLDLSAFEAAVAQAESEAAALESRLQGLSAQVADTVSALGQLSQAMGRLEGLSSPGEGGLLAGALGTALGNVRVELDGEAVGRLTAAYVDQELGQQARRDRWG